MDFSNICTGCGRPVFVFAREKYLRIIEEICDLHNVDLVMVMSESRSQNVVWARQAAYHALHQTGLSSSQVGRLMNRDHTTVLHGITCHKYRASRAKDILEGKKGRGATNPKSSLNPPNSAEGEMRRA